MNTSLKKKVGACAIGAISIAELFYLQTANATPVTFTGSTTLNPRGGSVQVSITVDGGNGTYRITGISTPVQPTGQNAAYASFAIPTLTQEALAAQSAAITGVTGASEISAAWRASLSSAIAAAASGGSPIGQSSVSVPVNPKPLSNPGVANPGTNSSSQVSSVIPTSVAVPPIFSPYLVGPYMGGENSVDLTPYFTAVTSAISAIGLGESDNRGESIAAALAAFGRLQVAVSQSQGSSAAFSAYISNVNATMQMLLRVSNQAISNYYSKVVSATNAMYTEAQIAKNAAATFKASPAPTVTVAPPAPTFAPVTIKAGSTIRIKAGSVIEKSFSCVKTVAGVKVNRTLKALIEKCPAGFTLSKR